MKIKTFLFFLIFSISFIFPALGATEFTEDLGFGGDVTAYNEGEADAIAKDAEARSKALQINFENFTVKIFGSLLGQLKDYQSAIYSDLTQVFQPLLRTLVALYFVFFAISLWVRPPNLISVVLSFFIFVSLHSIIIESTAYYEWVVEPVISTFRNLAGFFIASSGQSGSHFTFQGHDFPDLFEGIDYMLSRLVLTLDLMTPQEGFLSEPGMHIKAGMATLLLLVVYGFMYCAFVSILAMGFFGLYVLLLVGGICMYFAAFKETRFIFWAWFKSIFNYGLLIVFASIIVSICMFGVTSSLTKLAETAAVTNEIFTAEYLMAIFWAVIAAAMVLKAPDFASALTGGQAGSTTGIAAGVGMVGSSLIKGGNIITIGAAGQVSKMRGKILPTMTPGEWLKSKGFKQ